MKATYQYDERAIVGIQLTPETMLDSRILSVIQDNYNQAITAYTPYDNMAAVALRFQTKQGHILCWDLQIPTLEELTLRVIELENLLGEKLGLLKR